MTQETDAELREVLAKAYAAEGLTVDAFYFSQGDIDARDRAALNALRTLQAKTSVGDAPFQDRVKPWMLECFGPVIPFDKTERNHRFLEEALELVQSIGCTKDEAHQLVDYVFDRPIGEPSQEVGGVMVTLAALCIASNLRLMDCAEVELTRIWTKVEAIREKQKNKPKHSPLAAAPQPSQPDIIERCARILDEMAVVQGSILGTFQQINSKLRAEGMCHGYKIAAKRIRAIASPKQSETEK